ncbi:MAG: ribonuclease III domain-containing protein [Clostridia bacterium]|nr:ribonuclease III domain-containing protein [Clostridia bacterium]
MNNNINQTPNKQEIKKSHKRVFYSSPLPEKKSPKPEHTQKSQSSVLANAKQNLQKNISQNKQVPNKNISQNKQELKTNISQNKNQAQRVIDRKTQNLPQVTQPIQKPQNKTVQLMQVPHKQNLPSTQQNKQVSQLTQLAKIKQSQINQNLQKQNLKTEQKSQHNQTSQIIKKSNIKNFQPKQLLQDNQTQLKLDNQALQSNKSQTKQLTEPKKNLQVGLKKQNKQINQASHPTKTTQIVKSEQASLLDISRKLDNLKTDISKISDNSKNIYTNFLNAISPGMSKDVPPLLLAFIGDAVHTLFVRTFFIKNVNSPVGKKHTQCSSFCRAKSQADALDFISEFLNENELDIAKRARNSKNHSSSKNTDPEDYRKATSFEAVVGHLYITNQINKLESLLMKFMEKE